MPTATIFLNNRSQAVRLPKAVAFPDNVSKVHVDVVGDTRVLTPIPTTFSEWLAQPHYFDPDFMSTREQGGYENRDWDAFDTMAGA